MKNRDKTLAWTTSGVLHVAMLAAIAAAVAHVEPLALSIHSGGVTITAVMEPRPALTEEGDWHFHVPGVTQDHDHQTSEEFLVHRHETEPVRLEPQRIELARQSRAVTVTVRPLGVDVPLNTSLVAVSPAVDRPVPIHPPVPQLTRPERLARRTPLAQPPTVTERVQIPVAKSVSADDSGATVDEMPHKLPDNPAPPYPRDAYSRGQEGRVLLEVRVDAQGRVETIRVSQSSGVSSLDHVALQTVQAWRFQPARRGGVAVNFTVTVPVRFAIRAAR